MFRSTVTTPAGSCPSRTGRWAEMTGSAFVGDELFISVQHPEKDVPIGSGAQSVARRSDVKLDGSPLHQQRIVPRGRNWSDKVTGESRQRARPTTITIPPEALTQALRGGRMRDSSRIRNVARKLGRMTEFSGSACPPRTAAPHLHRVCARWTNGQIIAVVAESAAERSRWWIRWPGAGCRRRGAPRWAACAWRRTR